MTTGISTDYTPPLDLATGLVCTVGGRVNEMAIQLKVIALLVKAFSVIVMTAGRIEFR